MPLLGVGTGEFVVVLHAVVMSSLALWANLDATSRRLLRHNRNTFHVWWYQQVGTPTGPHVNGCTVDLATGARAYVPHWWCFPDPRISHPHRVLGQDRRVCWRRTNWPRRTGNQQRRLWLTNAKLVLDALDH